MKSHQISAFFLLMIVLLSSTLAQDAKGADECCFDYFSGRLRMNLITGYEETSKKCSKPGLIFYNKNGNELCVNPNARWVKRIKQKLDQQ